MRMEVAQPLSARWEHKNSSAHSGTVNTFHCWTEATARKCTLVLFRAMPSMFHAGYLNHTVRSVPCRLSYCRWNVSTLNR